MPCYFQIFWRPLFQMLHLLGSKKRGQDAQYPNLWNGEKFLGYAPKTNGKTKGFWVPKNQVIYHKNPSKHVGLGANGIFIFWLNSWIYYQAEQWLAKRRPSTASKSAEVSVFNFCLQKVSWGDGCKCQSTVIIRRSLKTVSKRPLKAKNNPKAVEFYRSGRSGRMTKKSHSINYGEGTWLKTTKPPPNQPNPVNGSPFNVFLTNMSVYYIDINIYMWYKYRDHVVTFFWWEPPPSTWRTNHPPPVFLNPKASAFLPGLRVKSLLTILGGAKWKKILHDGEASRCYPTVIHSLKLTWPLKIGHPKRKLVFQPFIFRSYVSFREGIFRGFCPAFKTPRVKKTRDFSAPVCKKQNGSWKKGPLKGAEFSSLEEETPERSVKLVSLSPEDKKNWHVYISDSCFVPIQWIPPTEGSSLESSSPPELRELLLEPTSNVPTFQWCHLTTRLGLKFAPKKCLDLLIQGISLGLPRIPTWAPYGNSLHKPYI